MDPTVITTHEFPFDRVGEAFGRLAAKEPGMIKPVILFPRPGHSSPAGDPKEIRP